MQELYAPFADKCEILYVKRRSSETIKYASNAFLAMKIHYINEMANFCEKAGADIYEVAKGMGLDTRIGKRFSAAENSQCVSGIAVSGYVPQTCATPQAEI